MGYAVLIAWLIQAAVGLTLLVGWARRAGGSGAPLVVAHVALVLLYLVPWVGFVITGAAWWAWISVGVLTIGIPFGDAMMTRRARRLRGEANAGMRDYGSAIAMVLTGKLPGVVTFHALFAPVVYFGSLGVAVGASVAGA